MNGENPFEERLRNLPQRPVPPVWRQEILSRAQEALPRASADVISTPLVSRLNSMVRALFWPNPRAWAGLAAIWMLVIGFNVATREPAQTDFAQRSVPPSPQLQEVLRQQERLLAELVGPNASPVSNLPRPATLGPRGERREDFVNT